MDWYVGAVDLVVCSYHSGAQVTSGVLNTALSKGKAIISTPFLHTREALTGGRGRLVNAKDPAAMSGAVSRKGRSLCRFKYRKIVQSIICGVIFMG